MSGSQRTSDYLVDDPATELVTDDIVDLNDPPLVSFCIPTLNDAATLSRFLESVLFQNYPDTEFVVADGGSMDETIDIAKEFGARVEYDDGTVGSARKTAFEASSGDIVAQFDADIVLPHDDWLINAVRRFNYGDHVSTVWPKNVAPPNAPPLTKLYFRHWELMIEDRIVKGRGFFGGGNALFRRSCLENAGGIDAELHWGEDFDWARRLHDAGYSVVYHRDPVYHDTMRSLRQFARKQFVGAETFTDTGFGLMGLTLSDVLYEQFGLGAYGMVRGLAVERDPVWLWYPPYLACRVGAYGSTYLKQLGNKFLGKLRRVLPR